ncbi:signal recognition particle-docking protein FtsY [Alienimonas chondri]|uniref:Signal recognition particle receptor FtsY n=1 Tax=Alienimonas chondri TaxID=2681879 RepID=A0ABX1VBB8_9PLAN|nr:signal recognition particle-docking protein FtsY [Alienimonas chondri]NNJ25241.1 Signal recognition particle receptor FtsY [Alienimonas chondri]
MALFEKFKSGLQKTRQVLNTDVRDLFKAGAILDEEMLEEFEGRLIRSDMGVEAADEIVAELRKQHLGRTVDPQAIAETVNAKLRDLLSGEDRAEGGEEENADPLTRLNLNPDGPTVILVSGVNGVGKTTSIAKLAKLLTDAGQSVVLSAGDTFRAAAVEQLTMWAGRIGCEIVTGEANSDPASVAHRGAARAKELGADVLILDTAGRLQTQTNLMNELGKIRRVVGKQIDGAPHESLLVIDATTGQNGLSQAEKFSEAAGCTGIVLSKLDGSAKGGVVIPIRRRMSIPVKFVGLGEGLGDLAVFEPEKFVRALEI